MFRFVGGKATLIAEIGGNHEGSLSKAKDLMFQAYEAGADIVKFQSYSGEGLVNKKLRLDRFNHFNRFMLTDDEWIDLAETAKNNGINFASSIWEKRYFDLLDKYIAIYKVGSGDLSNHELMKCFISTKKMIVLSTAMSSIDQIRQTYEFILGQDKMIIQEDRLAILQCTAMYDDPNYHHVNLLVMKQFEREFGCFIGFSNHAVGTNATIASIALGAKVVEFHFTDTKNSDFRDHKLSFDAADLRRIVSFNNEFTSILGDSMKTVHPSEVSNETEFRRGVYFNRPIKKGEIVKIDDLSFLRPELGISMWDLNKIVGKTTQKNISPLEVLDMEFFK
jgi:N,N'-diacetyllegionaminate synthase